MTIILVSFIMMILFAYILAIIFQNKTAELITYIEETPLLQENSNIRIILISDLHSTIYGKDQSPLINQIKERKPDLILLCGDIFDHRDPMTGTLLLLSGISGIAPVYYVTGNHEYNSGKITEIRELLKSHGVIILSDEFVNVEINGNEIILAGMEDPQKSKYEAVNNNQITVMENKFRELDKIPKYKILMAHRPELIHHYREFSFNMVLSGHAHGGQVRIPNILNGLYAPNQGLFPKYAGGLYRHENLVHIVSRGLSVKKWRPRVFNPPELIEIIIQGN